VTKGHYVLRDFLSSLISNAVLQGRRTERNQTFPHDRK